MSKIPVFLSLLLFAVITGASPLGSRLHIRHNADSGHDQDHSEELDCYASGVADWDKGLHIGVIFIVLATSGLGALLPVLSRYSSFLKVPQTLLTLGTFFGTGVIISTALIHMLPAGSDALNDPCVGGRMGNYSGWSGVLVMMAIFAMHLLEFILSNHMMDGHKHSHGLPGDLPDHKSLNVATQPKTFDFDNLAVAESRADLPTTATGSERSQIQDKIQRGSTDIASQDIQEEANCDAIAVHMHHNHVHGLSLIDKKYVNNTNRRSRISTYILELGICLHSVIIGLTLSVTTEGFKPLLVAIVFHQFCEGLALGSKIAQIKYERHGFSHALINAAFFMVITPIGMIIGIGVRSSYAPQSPGSLITIGVLDSLSAGILIYSGLVNLLAEEFGTLEFRNYSKLKKAACFASVFIGAGIMALIGKWA